MQRSLHSGELAIPQDLRTTFERLQVDAAAVNVDFDSHKKLKEATDAERRLREKAEAEATAELERQRRESEQVQLRRPREDLLIELGDVGELNYAAPSNDIGYVPLCLKLAHITLVKPVSRRVIECLHHGCRCEYQHLYIMTEICILLIYVFQNEWKTGECLQSS